MSNPTIGQGVSPNIQWQTDIASKAGQDSRIENRPATGKGMVAQSGKTPPAPPADAKTQVADLMSSLAFMNIKLSGASSEILIAEVAVAMRDTQSKSEKGKIELDQKTMQGLLKDQQAKIAEAEAKQAEAKEKKESASTADKIKLAFEWVGVVVAIVVAAVMIASGVGAVVGTLLLAAAATALVMAIDSTMKMTNEDGLGMAGQAAVGRGESKEKARKDDMITGITLAVAGAVFSIAGGGAGLANAARGAVQAGVQAGRAVYTITGSAAQATKAALSVAKDVFIISLKASKDALDMSMKIFKATSGVMEGVAAAGSTASGMASSIQTSKATIAEADVKRSEADAREVEALMAQINDMLDQAFSRLFASGDRYNQVIDAIMEARQDRAAVTAHFKFAG